MAHVAKLGGLTEELITIITSYSPQNNPSKFTRLRELSLRSIRHHNHGRTNQFDIASQYEGLVEKFSVHDKDSLAEALKERLHRLRGLGVKWEPEILHLLLELSDRPLTNTRLERLDYLHEPEPDPEVPLRWKDLLSADDPLFRDKSIWRNVDFTAESSEDEFEDSRSDSSDPTTVDSFADNILYNQPTQLTVPADHEDSLRNLRKSQYWLRAPSVGGVRLETVKKRITDLQAVREALFMILGLPTSLFTFSQESQAFEPSTGYTIKSASYEAYQEVMQDMARMGTKILNLRTWSKTPQSLPLVQGFQSSIAMRLMTLDLAISQIQQRFVAIDDDVVVSLLSIKTEVSTLARPVERLATIIERLQVEPYAHAFRYLEFLYEETCTSQIIGDETLYAFMGTIFFECFQLYLAPLRSWMEEGDLDPKDKVFFVAETSGLIEIKSAWESRYKLRKSQSGALHAPTFIHPAASKIFTTGKSVVILKQLNRFQVLQATPKTTEPLLEFQSVCTPDNYLAPFSELFNDAFEQWVESKHHHASANLRKILFETCGLKISFDMLLNTYFMANGANAAIFTQYVFDKLDILDPSWNDRFTLSELAQSIFTPTEVPGHNRLMIRVSPLPRKLQDPANSRRTVKTLSIIQPHHQLPWYIQIIITPSTILSYQRIFSFLFQIRRTTHILSRERLVKDSLTHTSSSSERLLYHSLRIHLLWFTQTLYYYLTATVLDPLCTKIRQDLKAAEDVDSMIAVHAVFIKLATDGALLGSRLEPIHKTVLKILDLGIRLEDAQATNAFKTAEAKQRQQELMDLSMGSLGLHTPKRKPQPRPTSKNITQRKRSTSKKTPTPESSDEEDDKDAEQSIDMSFLSPGNRNDEDLPFLEQLRKLKDDFDRLVRFVATGLRGVARAGGGEEANSWDLLGEMLEAGVRSDVRY